jgi:hypothetical protein
MGKRGPKPKGKVKIKWSPNFAYAIGLIATDGHLSHDGCHIGLTSKDTEQLMHFTQCLELNNIIGKKFSGAGNLSYRVQFGDVIFHAYLVKIGITPKKSKTIGRIAVPTKYFFDFLRGAFDGDGSFYSYRDPRWKSSFMFYTTFASASRPYLEWLQEHLVQVLGTNGHITHTKSKSTLQLKYAKGESLKILKNMYYSPQVVHLTRKRLKIDKALHQANVTPLTK